MFNTIIISAGCLAIGLVVGYLLGKRHKFKGKIYDVIANYSQHAVYMYLIYDEMYRARFNRWAKTDQGLRYMDSVSENLGGSIYLLPVDDKKEMEGIIEGINKLQ